MRVRDGQPHARSWSVVLRRNALSSGGGHALRALIGLAIAPYVLAKLGVTQYGLWATIWVLIDWGQLADLGMGRSLIKFYSEYHGAHTPAEIPRLMWLATLIYGVVTTALVGVLLAIRGWVLADVFKVPPELTELASFIYLGVTLIFALNLLFTPVSSLFAGLQRYDWLNGIQVGAYVVSTATMFVFLELGWGLYGMVLKTAVLSAVTLAASLYGARKLLAGLGVSLAPRHPFGDAAGRLRRLFTFSANVELSYVVRLLYDPINKMLLSNQLGLNAVAYYELGYKVLRTAEGFFRRVTVVIFPAGSYGFSAGGRAFVVDLYRKATKYTVLSATPLLVTAALFSPELISVWLRADYELTARTLSFLALPVLAGLIANTAFLLVQSIGKPQYALVSNVIRMLIHVAALLLLIGPLGYDGVLIASAAGMIASAAFVVVMFHRLLELDLAALATNGAGRGFVAGLLLSVLTAALVKMLPVGNATSITLAAITVSLGYTAVLLRGRILDRRDVTFLGPALSPRLVRSVKLAVE